MKYAEAFDAAREAVAIRNSYGEKYHPDVLRNAALAAAEALTDHDAVDAMVRVIEGARISINPNWDGSIA